jgi:hypothetical protein
LINALVKDTLFNNSQMSGGGGGDSGDGVEGEDKKGLKLPPVVS